MRGSIFKRGNLWTVQIERDRDPLTGKRRRELHQLSDQARSRGCPGRNPLAAAAWRARDAVEAHLRRLPARPLATDPASQLAPSTLESYAGNVRHHIVPGVGSASLQGLSADVLTRFYGDRLASGLSARTVRYLHSIRPQGVGRRARLGVRGPKRRRCRFPAVEQGSEAATAEDLDGVRAAGLPRGDRCDPDAPAVAHARQHRRPAR